MEYLVKVLEPTDLWDLQNNINKETNKYYHPTRTIPFVQPSLRSRGSAIIHDLTN
ncbi:hypothetical protein [Floridanema aerugineum]|jgi:hypothetical protein|uniref:Uncharacterized protein n=1 Tax=Floridaenema aerugineum BLCC-F46 TaxID=3153654 RepID=A0ABV4X5Z3_9CYAN